MSLRNTLESMLYIGMLTQVMLRTYKGNRSLMKKKLRYVTAPDLIKCLKEIKLKLNVHRMRN